MKNICLNLRASIPSILLACLCLVGRYAEAQTDREPTIEQLVKKLSDPDSEIRDKANAELLRRKDAALPIILDKLPAENPDVGLAALEIVKQSGKKAVPLLVKMLQEPNEHRLVEGLRLLGALEANGRDAFAAVEHVHAHPTLQVRVEVVRALKLQGGDKALHLLLKMADSDKDGRVKWDCLVALGEFRDQSMIVVPRLIKTMKTPESTEEGDHHLWLAAALGLVEIGKPAVREVAQVIAAKDLPEYSKIHALYCLQQMARTHGSRSITGSIEEVSKCLTDNSRSIREFAAETLGRIGPHGKPALPALVELLDRETGATKCDVAGNVLSIEPAHPKASQVLKDAMESADSETRYTAVSRIKNLQHIPVDFVPALIKGLADKTEKVRLTACHALASMRLRGKDALPKLRELARDDPSDTVRFSARFAIEQILK